MLFNQIIENVIPNAEETVTKDEVKRRIQEIAQKRKDLNSDWVRAAVALPKKETH